MNFSTKDEALNALEVVRAEWLAKARSIARGLARGGRTVTVDDVRAVMEPPAGADPRVMGALFRGDEWEPAGWVQSNRCTCHRRPIREFRLKVPQ